MSEEGVKGEVTSEQCAEEEIPSGDCEKSKGVESKMADGQQPNLAEGGQETQNVDQATTLVEKIDVETKPLPEKSASDTDGKADQVPEAGIKDEVENGAPLAETSPQPPSSTLDVSDVPTVSSDQPSAAILVEPQADVKEESQNATQEEHEATPNEEPQKAHVGESQTAGMEETKDVTTEEPQAGTIPEETQDASKEEPQDAVPGDASVIAPIDAQGSLPLEPSTSSEEYSSVVSEESVPSAREETSSEVAVNGQEVSKNNETEAEKSSHVKTGPPKVLPKPKYEPPEIKVDLFVKAHASFPNRLGDCPFCHRVMMTLKLKKIGGTVCPVNLNVKSREFEDFCAKHGLPTKVPIIQHGDTVMCDSNAIADYLDNIRPIPKLVCLSRATNAAGDKVFLKFSALIKNKMKANDAKLAQALTDELGRLDTFLSKSPGCFLDGDDLLHPDCILLPKLHHVRVAAKHYKKYDIPESFQYVHSYLAAADNHPVFASTKPPDDAIIEGWRKHAT